MSGCMSASFVPSPAVLRYLRIQTESLHFLSTSSKAAHSLRHPISPRCTARDPPVYNKTRLSSQARTFCTDYTSFRQNLASSNPARSTQCSHLQSTRSQCFLPKRHIRAASSWYPGAGSSSSEKERSWRRWSLRRQKEPRPLEPSDLPSPIKSGFVDDGASLGRVLKPGNELRLRCTEFDENGKVTLVNGEFKKSELIQKVYPQHASAHSATTYTDDTRSTVSYREIYGRSTPLSSPTSLSDHPPSSSTSSTSAV